jgi:methyltransferase (TIGR00027 family)
MALRILPPEVAARLQAAPRAFDRWQSRGRRAYLAARSRFAEDELAVAVRERGVTQYVIVGAGYDTFAFRNSFPELRVFEVDHPATQAVKRRRLVENGIVVPASVVWVAANIGMTSLPEALRASGFNDQERSAFSWLGVTPYIDRRVLDGALQWTASMQPGTSVVIDYALPRQARPFFGRLWFDRAARRVAAAGEPWRTLLTPAEMRELLETPGLQVLKDLGSEELNVQYFARRRDRLRVDSGDRVVAAVVA